MQVLEAQQTRVHHMPGLLAPAEVAAILALAQEVQTTDPEATLTFSDTVQLSQRGNWQTIYLHSGGAFQRKLPEIEEKLAELGAKAPGDVQYLDDADIADLQLSPEQGSRLKSVAAQAAAQP